MGAPVCPISRDQALPGMPGRQLPFAPRAMDLPSLIAAVNALRDLVLAIYGPGTPLNNMPGAGNVFNGGKGSAQQDPGVTVVVKNDWIEIYRDERRVRVYNGGVTIDSTAPEGPQPQLPKGRKKENYVDVYRINKMVFHWEHNDVSMPEDSFEWAYNKSDYMTDVWGMAANGFAFPFGQGPY
jgi:hypothetical protein